MTSSETEKLTRSIQEAIPDYEDNDAEPADVQNPFVHKVEWNNPFDKIRTIIFTIFVLPVRAACIVSLIIIAYLLAAIGLYGLTREDLKTRPIKGWRRVNQILMAKVAALGYAMGGLDITVKGRQVSRDTAPILVVAPHSSFLDSVVISVMNMASPLVRDNDEFLGKLINFTQPIYVCREDPDSRHNTIKEIIERANSQDDWSQVLIFPEGTCTNRTSLIQFKPGAFYPGVPIQPVVIRYPNKTDTVTWTWEGPEVLTLLWRTLTQFHTRCEIEFLPIYTPNEDEKRDAKLFARNVQRVMAQSLGIPISDYCFEDCRLMNIAKAMKIPHCADVADVSKLRKKLELDKSNPEEKLVEQITFDKSYRLTLCDFAKRLEISDNNVSTIKLFNLFAKPSPQIQEDNTIDLKEYLLCTLFLITANKPRIQLAELLFKVYGKSGEASQDTFSDIMRHVLNKKHSKGKAVEHLFQQIDKSRNGFVTFDDFHGFTNLNPEYGYLFDKLTS